MALIQRGGCTFYIRSVRRDGQVTSEYLGSGRAAVLMARLDAASRDERSAEAAAWRAEFERLDAAEKALSEWFVRVERIARAALTVAGFHQHKRQWRMRRAMSTRPATPAKPGSRTPPSREPANFLERAQDGDESAVPAVREFLEQRPHRLDEWGDAAYHAEAAVIAGFTKKNVLAREAMTLKMGKIGAELAGPSPTPMERLLARRGALCWYTVNLYETYFAVHSAEMSLAQSDTVQRRIDRAHRRLLSSLRTLATIRRIPVAAVQVNVETVNVEAPAPDKPTGPSLMEQLGARADFGN